MINAVVNVKKHMIVTFVPPTFIPTQKEFTVKERLERIERVLEEILKEFQKEDIVKDIC